MHGTRDRIVEELRRERSGLDVQELARRVGIHQNSVRWHLGLMRERGVVVAAPRAREAPGRPRVVYSLLPAAAADEEREFRLLATMLAGSLAETPDGSERAEATGRSWGRYLAPRPSPLDAASADSVAGQVAELLDEQGFAAEVVGPEILMRRCPYLELAAAHPEIVCRAHAGLIRGALEQLGGGVELERLEPFVEPELCIARLTRR